MMGVALLVALWVMSIILATVPLLHSTAEKIQHQLNGGASFAKAQILLSIICLFACCGRATCMYKSAMAKFAEVEKAQNEESRPLKAADSDSNHSDLEQQKGETSKEGGSGAMICL